MQFKLGETIPNVGILQRYIKKTQRWRVQRIDGSVAKLSEDEIKAEAKICRACSKGTCEGPVCNPCQCIIHVSCLKAALENGVLECSTCNSPFQGKEVIQAVIRIYDTIRTEKVSDPKIADFLTDVGALLESDGDHKKSAEVHEHALIILERAYGLDHLKVADALLKLGEAYDNLEEYKKMAEVTERALIIMEQAYGTDHEEVAQVLMNLRILYGRINERPLTIKECEQILAVKAEVHGSDSVDVIDALRDLANAYECVGEYESQCKYVQKAFAIAERVNGRDHSTTISLLEELEYANHLFTDQQKKRMCVDRSSMVYQSVA